ncbi:WXG100 family type VII secretion target [Nocardia macrotermitis]|uniref:WXG100 family type VII secretion target n=1 Tax=Nocardia macrotermitis TaxID=2585198 RepID=A0A7K0DF13_9NOCA|nr:WXG100 family type VII secretion target [Nocardia macrotermitis]MQY24380.1 hypothetical protein [Nocardia macrotermitis]
MGDSLQVDTDLARTLATDLAAIADDAQDDLAQLREVVDREGECWGNDEPGRTFAESYEPDAKKGLTSLQHLVDNLRSLNKGITDAADTFQDQDQDAGHQVRTLGQNSFETPTSGNSYDRSAQPASSTSNPTSDTTANSNGVTGTSSAANPSTTTRSPGTTESPYPTPNHSPAAAQQQPTAADPGNTASTPADTAGKSPTPGNVSPASSEKPAAQPISNKSPAGTPKVGDGSTGSGKSTQTPWSGPAAGSPARNASGTPWAPSMPGGSSPGRVFPPRRAAGPAPRTPRGREPARPKRAKYAPTPGDAAALDALRALAARHDLRLTGFDTVPLIEQTVIELVAAVDDILGKYPFLEFAGIGVTELGEHTMSQVLRDRARTERTGARAGPWILLDRKAFTDPRILAEKVSTTAYSGEPMPEFAQRPMYSTIVADLGRVLEAAAGAEPRRLAQRSLIVEYRRISGEWDRHAGLPGVVGGYRRWRAQLSSHAFDDERFRPRAALVAAFAEVELRGANAGAPAKVLHRLVVEHARGRSDTR